MPVFMIPYRTKKVQPFFPQISPQVRLNANSALFERRTKTPSCPISLPARMLQCEFSRFRFRTVGTKRAAADNSALLPKCYHGLRMQSDIILENSYRRDRNATRNLKDFARFYDTIPHKKSSTVFPADFAASSVERKFGSFRAQDKNPFPPHLTACMYVTMQVPKVPFSNGRGQSARPQTIWR